MAQFITPPSLSSINLAVSTAYNKQFGTADNVWKQYAYSAQSSGAGEVYPRLDLIPGLREWVGARVINQLSLTTFQILNKTFEETISIKRTDIEDDRYGLLAPAAEFLGQNAGNLPDQLCAQLMLVGNVTPCYDKQNFFDPNHPDFTNTGAATTSSNYLVASGSDTNGPAWFLIDDRQVLRPIIFQERRPFVITPKFSLTDDNVFFDGDYIWGIDGRCNAGFGIWQTALMCTAPLNAKYFEIARNLMVSRRRPDGTPMNIKPTLCMVPSTLLGSAKSLFEGEYMDPSQSGGVIQSNRWKGAAKILENTFLN